MAAACRLQVVTAATAAVNARLQGSAGSSSSKVQIRCNIQRLLLLALQTRQVQQGHAGDPAAISQGMQ